MLANIDQSIKQHVRCAYEISATIFFVFWTDIFAFFSFLFKWIYSVVFLYGNMLRISCVLLVGLLKCHHTKITTTMWINRRKRNTFLFASRDIVVSFVFSFLQFLSLLRATVSLHFWFTIQNSERHLIVGVRQPSFLFQLCVFFLELYHNYHQCFLFLCRKHLEWNPMKIWFFFLFVCIFEYIELQVNEDLFCVFFF